MSWSLYIIRCRDESLYTGITTDIPRRLKEHNAKKGAFYTQNKTPVELVYQEAMANQSEALKREAAIKRLTKKQKLELISFAPNPPAKISCQSRETAPNYPISLGVRFRHFLRLLY